MLNRLKMMFGTSGSFLSVHAPFAGQYIKLEDVEDEIFKKGTLGNGFAILPDPDESILRAPIGGEVMLLSDMSHAIMIKTLGEVELLVHLGLGTVKLKGQHLKTLVKHGDFIKVGDPLIEFDQDAIKNLGYSMVTPIVTPNPGKYSRYEIKENLTSVRALDEIMKLMKPDD